MHETATDHNCTYGDQYEWIEANDTINTLFKIYVQHANKYMPVQNTVGSTIGTPYIATLNGSNFSNYTPQNVTINGNSYNSVYIMPNNNLPNNFIYHSTQLGVIAYDDSNGHLWMKIN